MLIFDIIKIVNTYNNKRKRGEYSMAKEKSANYVLTLSLKTKIFQEDILNKRFNICRQIYNSCLGELLKRYNHMRESKEYRRINKLPKGKDKNKQFSDLNKLYNLTEYSLHEFVKPMCKHFKNNIDSLTGQKLASRAYLAFEKLMFHTAKRVNFIKYDELQSIEGKWNKSGIKYDIKANQLVWNGLKINVIIKSNDLYVQKAIQDKVKYCRIKREMIKGKYHYYIQLIMEGIPPVKVTKQGEIKGEIGSGNVGIDIGTQTIGISSKYSVKLLELCPEINNIDRQIKLLQRKMDRSKRATNPNKYNENGTINTKNKDKWVYSNHYIKIKNIRKELYRKQSAIRKQSHNILANKLLNLGDTFYVETMSYSGLQKRSKNTIVNKNGKFNKKKRFGKSLANKAPSMFLTILDNKLKWNNTQLNRIDTYSIKASQYNHITDEYNKKQLSERWNIFNIDDKEVKIQRDLYSAFLIMNVKNNLKEIDRELCFSEFDYFKKLHDLEIERILNSDDKVISSMGL